MCAGGYAELADSGQKPESIGRVLTVAVLVSLVCSVVVASAAVLLKPRQLINERVNVQRNILEVAGLLEPGADVQALFQRVETRLVDFESGALVHDMDPESFDAASAARDPVLGQVIPRQLDLARIGRRARLGKVYFVRSDGAVQRIILPVRGYGLWSTMYGFLALAPDGVTIDGISFYEHAETPGLGDQIDDPRWRASWKDKLAFDAAGEVRITVIKGRVSPGTDATRYQVDGLSGATLTANGVTNLLRYWLGAHGYGPFLSRLRSGEAGI